MEITNSYIDDVIKANQTGTPNPRKTSGTALRDLIKKLRNNLEAMLDKTSFQVLTGRKRWTQDETKWTFAEIAEDGVKISVEASDSGQYSAALAAYYLSFSNPISKRSSSYSGNGIDFSRYGNEGLLDQLAIAPDFSPNPPTGMVGFVKIPVKNGTLALLEDLPIEKVDDYTYALRGKFSALQAFMFTAKWENNTTTYGSTTTWGNSGEPDLTLQAFYTGLTATNGQRYQTFNAEGIESRSNNGSVNGNFHTTLKFAEPTGYNTIMLPDRNGTVALLSDIISSSNGITALTGDITASGTGNVTAMINTINGVTKSYYDPTSSIQTQLNSKGGLSSGNTWNGVNTFNVTGTGMLTPFNATANISGTGSGNFGSVQIRNTHGTNNKVQFTLGGGAVGTVQTRTYSFGVDYTGAGNVDFYIYNGKTVATPLYIDVNGNMNLTGATGAPAAAAARLQLKAGDATFPQLLLPNSAAPTAGSAKVGGISFVNGSLNVVTDAATVKTVAYQNDLRITSPDGTVYKITVANGGAISAVAL